MHDKYSSLGQVLNIEKIYEYLYCEFRKGNSVRFSSTVITLRSDLKTMYIPQRMIFFNEIRMLCIESSPDICMLSCLQRRNFIKLHSKKGIFFKAIVKNRWSWWRYKAEKKMRKKVANQTVSITQSSYGHGRKVKKVWFITALSAEIKTIYSRWSYRLNVFQCKFVQCK